MSIGGLSSAKDQRFYLKPEVFFIDCSPTDSLEFGKDKMVK